MQHREIFAPKYFREIAKHFDLERDVPELPAVRQRVADWKTSYDNGTIIKQSEIQLQKEFLQNFFAACLGYRGKIGRHDWELDAEFTTEVDATRADGYLGFFTPDAQKTVAVIELKDATTDLDRPQNRKNDKRTPVEQAFSYVPKVGPDCRWVIVSNFVEIRLYHAQDQSRYEKFNITQLHDDEQLKRFIFLLHRDHLLPAGQESKLDFWHRQRLEQEQTISIDFYKKFKDTRLRLFEHLRQFNPAKPELLLFEKTQKLLDRLIFVFFCEDKSLLPYDMTRKVKQAARASLDPAEGQTIWQQLKGLFRSIDKGNPPQNINRYNGGLFAHDPELDELQLGDGMAEVLLGLSNFDFDSDLDVNILGHIFEQSISDIEEIKANLAGIVTEKKQGKRKKDGIFYTPEYITRYIVREAVGGWLDDRKRALGCYELPELSDADLASVKMQKGRPQGNAKVERHRAFWTAYREALANIKVLDPACGSGAFLVQVFDYLSAEGQALNDELARLSLGLRSTDDLSRNILTNNIFGVDINPESVEISKLSLWLKTADNQSELTALDRNIRCGNSLIDDPAVAGDLAFDWKKEFADIFQEKGGFDVVVGNPPYVRVQNLKHEEIDWYKAHKKSAHKRIDISILFVELGLNLLINLEGKFAIISSNQFFKAEYGRKIREIIKGHLIINLDFSSVSVFEGLATYVSILVFTKKESENLLYHKVNDINSIFDEINWTELSFDKFTDDSWDFGHDLNLNEKIQENSLPLENVCDFVYGIITGFDQAFVLGQDEIEKLKIEQDIIVPLIKPENYKKFLFKNVDRYIIYPYDSNRKVFDETSFRLKFPNAYAHLLRNKDKLESRKDSRLTIKEKRLPWYVLMRNVPYSDIISPKILFYDVGNHPNFLYSEEKLVFGGGTTHSFSCKPEFAHISHLYLLGVLNSKLLIWYIFTICPVKMGDARKYGLDYIKRVPIKNISPEAQAPFISAADKMLALHRALHEHKRRFLALLQAEFSLPGISRALENWESLDFAAFLAELTKQKISLSLAQKSEWLSHFEQQRAHARSLLADIQSTDRQIDDMVFDLYGLTPEERALVRGA